MDNQEAEVILEACLEAVQEQYILPMMLALGTLTAVACKDPDSAAQVASALHKQAESCPPDVAGRALLKSLAALAGGPTPVDPTAVQDAVHRSLQLIQGGKTEA